MNESLATRLRKPSYKHKSYGNCEILIQEFHMQKKIDVWTDMPHQSTVYKYSNIQKMVTANRALEFRLNANAQCTAQKPETLNFAKPIR